MNNIVGIIKDKAVEQKPNKLMNTIYFAHKQLKLSLLKLRIINHKYY